MAKNLVEVDAHTTPVTVPEDGDARNAASVETPFQALANRTNRANLRLNIKDQFALYRISGAAVAQNAKATLTELIDPATAFGLASDEVSFPAVGYYLVTCCASFTSSDAATNPRSMGITAMVNAVDVAEAFGYRFSATAAHVVAASFQRILQVANISTEKLSLLLASGAGNTTSIATVNSYLSIQRLT